MGGIGSVRRETGRETAEARGSGGTIPSPRNAADAYRVSDDQVDKARLVVAENSYGTDDLRQLLDMLGLIGSHPDQPPPVAR